MKFISVEALKMKLENHEDFQLVDVREAYERCICNLSSEHIPLEILLTEKSRIRKDAPVVMYCRSGDRAKAAVAVLEQNHGFNNLYVLQGGIVEWANRMDPDMETY